MTHYTIAKARDNFADLVNRAAFGKERAILTRRGKQLAAVVPIEDVRLLEAMEEKIDLREVREALKEAEAEGTIPWETVKKTLGL